MKKIIACGLMFFCGAALSGQQSGKVREITVRASDGLQYFKLEGTATNRPACAAVFDYWMIANENSTAGKAQLAMLLAAQAQQKTITVIGSNTCTRWKDGEDVNTILF